MDFFTIVQMSITMEITLETLVVVVLKIILLVVSFIGSEHTGCADLNSFA